MSKHIRKKLKLLKPTIAAREAAKKAKESLAKIPDEEVPQPVKIFVAALADGEIEDVGVYEDHETESDQVAAPEPKKKWYEGWFS